MKRQTERCSALNYSGPGREEDRGRSVMQKPAEPPSGGRGQGAGRRDEETKGRQDRTTSLPAELRDVTESCLGWKILLTPRIAPCSTWQLLLLPSAFMAFRASWLNSCNSYRFRANNYRLTITRLLLVDKFS